MGTRSLTVIRCCMNKITNILAYIGTVTNFACWLFKGMFLVKSRYQAPVIKKRFAWDYHIELAESRIGK